jgi:excisionase family DNA binding protein
MSEERTLSSEMAELVAEFFEIESRTAQAMARARVLFGLGSDVAARAEAEVRRRELNFYTEEQAARKMQISKDTLQRLRTRHNLPHVRAGALVRYTDEQLAKVVEMLERPRRAKRNTAGV